MSEFKNKKYLITGASSGIGRQIAINLSKLNAKVVLVARDEEKLKQTLSLMDKNDHFYITYDLNDTQNIETLIKKAVNDGVKFDGFIHCAGAVGIYPLRVIDEKKINEVFNVNTFSYLNIIKTLSKKQYSNNFSSFVYLSSTMPKKPTTSQALYISSKSASESFAKVLSLELAKRNIRINNIIIGGVLTNMTHDTKIFKNLKANSSQLLQKSPMLKLVSCKEVANMVSFLLSDEALFIVGEDYYCDGGFFYGQ